MKATIAAINAIIGIGGTRQVSSMIHSARPTVSPVAKHCFVLLGFEKWGLTDIRTTCAKTMIPTGRDCGSAEWINSYNGP